MMILIVLGIFSLERELVVEIGYKHPNPGGKIHKNIHCILLVEEFPHWLYHLKEDFYGRFCVSTLPPLRNSFVGSC